MFEAENITAR